MIISPPFLQIGAGSRVDLESSMRGDMPGKGAFPVSYDLGWHGGIHLTALDDGSGALPVRAIADGIIKYAGKPDTDIDEHSPLYYHTGETSNGVVVIEHKTEIGEDVEAIFYSITMHLIELSPAVIAGEKIYRKDVLGNAGYIYGEPNRIHLEIICDDVNLKKLIGRTSGKLDISQDGRTEALWGEMYFAIPAGTAVFDACAESRREDAKNADYAAHQADEVATKARKAVKASPHDDALKQAATHAGADATAAHQAAKEVHNQIGKTPTQIGTIDTQIFVGMRYEKGTCTFTTYAEDGDIIGTRQDAGYEYNLYDKSCELYPECPSAGFELLRFGRVIGPDELKPATAQHWRKVIYTKDSEGWIDLRPDAIKKFSDADFPHWKHWLLIDDDINGDSRCDSATIKRLLKPGYDATTTILQLQGALLMEDTFKRLQRTICKMPSTWSDERIDQRWSWVKSQSEMDKSANLQEPITDENYEKLKAHIAALTFWSKTGLPDVEYWHFSPREFIGVFRECGWLSLSEMTQMFPMTAMRSNRGAWVSEQVKLNDQAKTNLLDNRTGLNNATRKFNISTPQRMACFYGNAMQETGWFSKLHENNLSAWYYPWDGRGFLQLTGPGNYFRYWKFLGYTVPTPLKTHLESAYAKKNTTDLQDANNPQLTHEMLQRRERTANDQSGHFQSESACTYWSWIQAAKLADSDRPYVLDQKTIDRLPAYYYTNESFGQVAATVNFGQRCSDIHSINKVNGIVARYQAYIAAIWVFGDAMAFPDSAGNTKLIPKNFRPRRS